MTSRIWIGLAAAALVTACQAKQEPKVADNEGAASPAAEVNDPIASAERAAPAAISKDAGVMNVDDGGKSTMLRESKNGWVCMPDSPGTPGPDPMCMDANALKWADAWIKHDPPPADAVGLIYMLEGGTDASNTDPYATAPTEENAWIKTGPHLMVVGSPSLNASYKGDPKPDTTTPYVMWAGTPYAHLMVPIQ